MPTKQILTEIHRLLDQQEQAIKGKLDMTIAVEYASRRTRIEQLVAVLTKTEGQQGDD